MDLNKLRYSKTVAVKDMEAHSNKTEKAAVLEKDNSLSVGKMPSDYSKGEATIETKSSSSFRVATSERRIISKC